MISKISFIRTLKIVLSLCLVIFIVVMVSMEVSVNYLLNHPEKIPGFIWFEFHRYYMDYDRNQIQFDEHFARYDSNLLYTLRPGDFEFSNREFNTSYHVNSKGFRDNEASLQQPDIAVLGDSYAMGWGVEQDSTFAQLLESKLNLKVLNLAVSSYGTAREIASLKKISTVPEIIIIQYGSNDFLENKSYAINGNYLPISSESDYLNAIDLNTRNHSYYPGKHFLKIDRWNLIRKIYQQFFVEGNWKLYDPDPVMQSEAVSREQKEVEVKYFLNILEHSALDFDSTQIYVLEINYIGENNPSFIRTLEEMIANNEYPDFIERIKTVDLSQILRKDHYFILDDHLNAKGHRAVAKEIIRVMSTQAIDDL